MRDMMKPMFRFAVETDTALILQFIRKLAEYEKMLDQVVADEDLLREQLFEKRQAEVIFALENGKEVGFALFFHNFSTFLGRSGLYLEDLFVLPEHRGKGYATAAVVELIRLARESGQYDSLLLGCAPENHDAEHIYRKLGFIPTGVVEHGEVEFKLML